MRPTPAKPETKSLNKVIGARPKTILYGERYRKVHIWLSVTNSFLIGSISNVVVRLFLQRGIVNISVNESVFFRLVRGFFLLLNHDTQGWVT